MRCFSAGIIPIGSGLTTNGESWFLGRARANGGLRCTVDARTLTSAAHGLVALLGFAE